MLNNLITQSKYPTVHCNINNVENIIGSLKKYEMRPASIEYSGYGDNYYTENELTLTLENWVKFNKDCIIDAVDRKENIEKVIFNDPATIVYWKDGTKTVVKCQEGDTYDKEKGLAMCVAKKFFGNKGNFNKVFNKFIGEDYE